MCIQACCGAYSSNAANGVHRVHILDDIIEFVMNYTILGVIYTLFVCKYPEMFIIMWTERSTHYRMIDIDEYIKTLSR